MFTQSENRGKGIFLIAVVAVFAMAVFFGCNQPPAPVQTAKPAEPVQQPAAAPQPAAPQAVQPQAPAAPPAQLGKGSSDPSSQAAIPTEAKLNMQQGMNYLRSRDYDNAIKEFTVAIQKHPTYDVAYSNRAVAYMQQQKFNKAADDLKKGVEINPNNATLHYNLVALYSLQNHIDRALDSLDRSLELGFNNYDALRTDPDLNNVRKHPEFRKICEKYKVFIAK
jgi:tetratricopeptide (TPR) repeat protein